MTENSREELKKLFHLKDEKVLIVTHRNPDGDAMGSSLGLYNVLRIKEIECNILFPNNFAEYYQWMPGSETITKFDTDKEKGKKLIAEADYIVCVDFNDLSRIQEFEDEFQASKAVKILIDHHPNPSDFTDYMVSRTDISSASELVLQIVLDLGYKHLLTKDSATCFYTGIMTDTGCFSFNSSYSQTFKVVGELLEFHIDKDNIYNRVYNTYSEDRMRLMGFCLKDRLVHFPELRTAYIYLSLDDLERHNFKTGDTEGFVNLPLSIDNVVFSALFTEKNDRVKLSLRSKGSFAVNALSDKYFKGGGHVNAAGGESFLSLEKTLEKFNSIILEYKDELLKG